MNIRRKLLIGACAVLSAGFAVLGAACTEAEKYRFDYEPSVVPELAVDATPDAGMSVDGVKEAVYGENSLSFVEVNSGITVTTWAYMGENGLYLYTETDDKSVYYSDEKAFHENDTVEYYLDPNPDYSVTLQALSARNKVRSDCIQLRVNSVGGYQMWCGRPALSGYPWIRGYFPVLTGVRVMGEINKADGAEGYAVEAFIPWKSLGHEEKPDCVGVMPAFNNVSNREDTSRTWFSVKGMSHDRPAGYGRVEADGFVDVGYSTAPEKELTAQADDAFYTGEALPLKEVTAQNSGAETRAELKYRLGNDGIYFLAKVHDKVYTHGSDVIWNNDGLEIVVDAAVSGGGSVYRGGILRVGADIDGGVETDIAIAGYGDYVPQRRAAFVKTTVSDYEGESAYGYRYTYVYELMVPYASLGLEDKPEALAFGWAVKTPNETAYILDRRGGAGQMEGQDWLWADRHYPMNPGEYFMAFPAWKDFSEYDCKSDAPARYNYRAAMSEGGLFLNVEQYVDNYVTTGDMWGNRTHLEMKLWNDKIGYTDNDTFFAFFPFNDYYDNSLPNASVPSAVTRYRTWAEDRGEHYDGYRYKVVYNIWLDYDAGNAPSAEIKLLNFMPGESGGFGNAELVYQDSRAVWTDACKTLRLGKQGIEAKTDYNFPAWTAWEDCTVRSDAQTRYDYRGLAADDGLYINMVQYVDSYAFGGAGGDWTAITHIEMEIWNHCFGHGMGGTYFGFFLDGSYYCNNAANLKIDYRASVTDRGADFADGYRYAISYEIFLNFANNTDSADDPYGFVKFMSYTPGESAEGYGNASLIAKDANRLLWTDDCNSYSFGVNGIAGRDDGFRVSNLPAWEDCAIRSDAQTRYDFRGYAADNGLNLQMVQYVDNIVLAGNKNNFGTTHYEFLVSQHEIGYGFGGTFFAIFLDGSCYNNSGDGSGATVTTQQHVAIKDRGEDFAGGYRYMITYDIHIEFANNLGAPQDGPYAFVEFMSFTPGESNEGYETAVSKNQDGRQVWKDEKNSEFRRGGLVNKG